MKVGQHSMNSRVKMRGQPGREETTEEIRAYLAADYPLIYLNSAEEEKAIKLILSAAEQDAVVYTHDSSAGLQCIRPIKADDKLLVPGAASKRKALLSALLYIEENIKVKALVIFKDPNHVFANDDECVRAFKNCIAFIRREERPTNLLIVSSFSFIPPALDKDTVVVDVPFPTRDEIRAILAEVLEKDDIKPPVAIKNKVVEALNGLTEDEVRRLVTYCIVDDKELDEDDIRKINTLKRQITKKSGVLEFVQHNVSIEEVGGLDALKRWLKPKKEIFSRIEEAVAYGVDIPKGVLLVGMPGCGKSIVAKAIGSFFDMPTLRLDMGAIMGPYLGQSEENLRKAFKLAESVAPSILWIDELEKALAGAKGGSTGGSDTSVRIFGSILTWMQENTKPVFIVATANDVSTIPPEFKRKGRFDESFFVDLPNQVEAAKILEIHLRKRNKQLDASAVKSISRRFKGYCGADIEAVVKAVVEESFCREQEPRRKITVEDFDRVLNEFMPISETMGKQIEALRKEITAGRFRSAT